MERVGLGELADAGVLLASRALQAGWPRPTLFRKLGSEGWTRIQAGAWIEPGRDADLATRLRAVQLLKPGLVVSHRSTAVLWGIETLDPVSAADGSLEFIDPELTIRREGSGVVVHRMPLEDEELARREGLRVTGVGRTLADLLRSGTRDEALVAVESALTWRRAGDVRRAPVTTVSLIALALEAPLRGAGRARRRLKLADPNCGSPAETIARLRLYDAGLHPETQVELRTPDGRRRYLDFLFRAEGLAVEIEGYAYHGSREAHRRDIARFNQVLQCPEVRLVLRYTAVDVFRRPAMMLGEIQAALAQLRGRAS
jgi:very-short-patch-repair endonuclease